MGWPNDARHFTFGKGLWVPSVTLNEMEDRIVDLHRERTRVFWPSAFECETAGTGLMGWVPQGGVLPWFGCLYADKSLWIPISFQVGVVVKAVDVKVYKTADGIRAYLDKVDIQTDGTATTAPTFSNLSAPAASSGGAPCWEVIDLSSGLPVTLAADEVLLVRLGPGSGGAPAVGDMCAGANVTFEPITPTP